MKSDTHILGRPLGLVLIAAYKAVWGLLEVGLGVLLVVSGQIIKGELVEDPEDFLANWLLKHVPWSGATVSHVGWVFLGLGLLKLVLAIGVWFASWKVRRWLMIFLGLVTAIAAFALARDPSRFRVVALVADLVAFTYLWKFLPFHLRERPPAPPQ